LFNIAGVPIARHQLVRNLNPYLPENYEYFRQRAKGSTLVPAAWSDYHFKVLRRTKGFCLVCDQPIVLGDSYEVHHIKPRKAGGSDHVRNLIMLHKNCHKVVTHTRNPKVIAKFKSKGVLGP